MSTLLVGMGKLPLHDEYVRVHDTTAALVAFDGWVTENMEAAARLGDAFGEHYADAPAHAFVYAPAHSATVVAGAIAPSADRAGRRFPIMAAREVEIAEDVVAALELSPLYLEELWDAAGRAVTAAAREGSSTALEAGLALPPAVPPPGFPHDVENWGDWTREVRLDDLGATLFHDEELESFRDGVLLGIDAVAPLRGLESPKTRLALRLPLGRAGGAAVCFWLALVRRVAGWSATVPSFFWTHDGVSGSLFLCPGTPPKSVLGQLWMPRPAEGVVDVRAGRGEGAALAAVERILAAEGATVSDLLDAL